MGRKAAKPSTKKAPKPLKFEMEIASFGGLFDWLRKKEDE